MTMENAPNPSASRPAWLRILIRPDVLAGLFFTGVATFGLAVSWNYPIGTAVRMGTGYVPRLMLWILFGLGVAILVLGVRGEDDEVTEAPLNWRPLVFVPGALMVFALTIEDLGFVIAGTLLVLIAGMATSASRVIEVIISAVVLVISTWAVFVWALGLTFPVWPGG